MATNYCLRCQRDTEIILDYRARYKTCSRCGLSLKFDHIDETPEPPSRPKDSMIIKTAKKGFRLIEVMAERLGVAEAVKERVYEIYNTVDVLRTCRGRSMNAVVAACLFIACRETRDHRTLKEVSAVADGTRKKDINRAIEAIRKQLEVETRTVQPQELIKPFCSKLGLQNQAIKVVEEAVRRIQQLDIRRSPKSVVAAIIYIVIQLSNDQKPVKDIADATEVTELTIRKSFKDISPYASKVIPCWLATEEEIKKIPTP
ncbi:hypothetical protein PTKIN_Ptkin07bG0065000 [Pterospermum kingtungense]